MDQKLCFQEYYSRNRYIIWGFFMDLLVTCLYRIDSGVDIGPQDLSEEVFNRECLRWVKIILYLAQCFGSGSALILIGWIRIQEGKFWGLRLRLKAEGFSCSLDAFMEAQVSGSGSPKSKNDSQKLKKNYEISCFEVLDVLFWGLKASLVA